MKYARTVRVLLTMAGTFVLYAGVALAQMDPGTGSPPKDKKSAVRPPTTEKELENKKEAGAEEEPEPTNTKTGTKTSERSTPTDPIVVLREQIDSAANGQERGRLQLNLADHLVTTGKQKEALDELHRSITEDRFDPQGFYNAGNALAHLGDANGAVNAYRKAIEQRNGNYSRAYNNLGVLLMRQGQWQEAHDALTKALQLESFHYAEASYNLGRLYAIQGEMDLAIREWRRAVKVDPRHTAAAQALSHTSYDDLIKVSDSKPADTKPQSHLPEALTPGSDKLRSASTSRSLTVDSVTFDHLQRARNARERGKNQEALQNYRAVISRMGGYFGPANLELSYVLIGLKHQDEALNYLRPVTIRDGSRYPISFYHLGRIYELNGNLELAAEAYGQAAKHYSEENPQFLLDVSRVREKLGDYAGALAAMQSYVWAMERRGVQAQWSQARLAALIQKVDASK